MMLKNSPFIPRHYFLLGVLLCLILLAWSVSSHAQNPLFGNSSTAPATGIENKSKTDHKNKTIANPSVRASQKSQSKPQWWQQWQSWKPFRNWVGRIAQWQRSINQQLSQAIKIKNNPLAIWTLISLSFLYGVLHAAGPGHGKFITSAYYLSQPTPWSHVLLISSLNALVQAFSAIMLVTFLVMVLQTSSRLILQNVVILEALSYTLIAVLGAVLLWRAILGIGCGHNHHALPQVKQAADESTPQLTTAADSTQSLRWVTILSMSLAIGIRPCAGAILVLLFSLTQQVYWAGVVATLAMGAGVALTLSLLGLSIITSQHWVSKTALLQKCFASSRWLIFQRVLMGTGAVAVMLMGILFLAGTLERI